MEHKRKILHLAGFIFALPVALMSYVNSSYISSFIGEKSVGVVYTLASLTSIVALLLVPKIFRKIGGYKFLLSVVGINVISILLFAFSQNSFSVAILFVLCFVCGTMIVFSLDELLKILSRNSSMGQTRGLYLAISSLAWVIAQFASGAILGAFSFRGIYLTSFALMGLFFIVAMLTLKNSEEPKYDKTKALTYLKEFFKNKNLARAYKINLLLQFFYCWMVIYTPIYLSLHLGFSWREISIIFAIMLMPFVLIQPFLGKYSDKIGERAMMMCGFFIISFATMGLFFIEARELWVWALALFLTRVGAATVEVMSDVYFFKHIKPENDEFIGVYRSISPIAYTFGPILALGVFAFIPTFNFIYIILGAIMLSGIYLASTIRKSDI